MRALLLALCTFSAACAGAPTKPGGVEVAEVGRVVSAPQTSALPEAGLDHDWRAEGREAAEKGDLETALDRYEKALRRTPSAAVQYDVAWTLERLGRRTEAASAYQRYLEVYGADLSHTDHSTIQMKVHVLRVPAEP